ncbi:MAG: chromate transporter [Burkholderiales bacterium]|nr:chromate transporter [Burkholderiales bacterium]
MPPDQAPVESPHDADGPKVGPLDLFLAFSQLALSGFGGVLPWAHRTLVERRGWLTQREFVETLALGQLLPGPNIGNMAVMIGYRFAGYAGAVAAIAGLVGGPFLLMIAAGLLYSNYGALPLVQQALSGMSAVAAGLVLATGLKMAGSIRRHWRPWLFTALALAGVGALRWPLLAVVGALAPFAIAAAWRDEA